MSTNDGAECWNITMLIFAKIRFLALKPKTQCINEKKLGLFSTLDKYYIWLGPEARSRMPIIHCTSLNHVLEDASVSILANIYLDQSKNFEIHKIKLDWNYTQYCIQCHMVFYVTVVTSPMTLFMNKFTSIVIPTYSYFVHFWYILHPNIL